ncbi:MAG: class I SAM-dependent methyltransferase [Thermomicrobiales bacterium]
MRYYRDEHETAYRAIVARGLTQWNDLFDDAVWTYDEFQNRAFLETVIPSLGLPAPAQARVLEYGCGTGPAACFLAAQGFAVDAFDLIPEAIAIARRMAEERGVRVGFRVADICDLASEPAGDGYDLVLDSFCLQSIVTDEDRAALFAAVRARLKPTGAYLISTAIVTPERTYDPGTYDADTGIVLRVVDSDADIEGVVTIEGRHVIPHRRHRTPDALRDELTAAGFMVASLDVTGTSADVVCRRATPVDTSESPAYSG